MKHKIWAGISLIAAAGLLLVPLAAAAETELTQIEVLQQTSLVIYQVQVSGTAGASDEFIQLYNRGNTAINLAGWSIQYKTATGNYPLTSKKNLPDFELSANHYYLIGHTEYAGLVTADLTHSSFALSGAATGATIYLVKSTNAVSSVEDLNIIDRLAYGTGGGNAPLVQAAPLPPADQSLVRIKFEGNNSIDYEVKNSAPQNSQFQPPLSSDNPDDTTDSQASTDSQTQETTNTDDNQTNNNNSSTQTDSTTQTDTQNTNTTNSQQNNNDTNTNSEQSNNTQNPSSSSSQNQQSSAVQYSNQIIISELLANPDGADSGEEWIELYNPTNDSINLKDWILDDNGSTNAVGSSAVKLPDVWILAHEYKAFVIPEGKFTLGNSGNDAARLFWPNQTLVKTVEYSATVKEGQSWCVINTQYEWCKATPNAINQKLLAQDVEYNDLKENLAIASVMQTTNSEVTIRGNNDTNSQNQNAVLTGVVAGTELPRTGLPFMWLIIFASLPVVWYIVEARNLIQQKNIHE